MAAASRLTAQNQTSVPAEVRQKLGIGPGAQLRWEVRGDTAIVTAKRSTLAELQRIARRRKVKHATDAQIRAGIIAGATRGFR